ncbi:hypothetical protein G6L26_000450 [Agrobacterium radiobacter]|jgi:hypothetical protein|uniref:hypothetical protein n=1 Tax=Agrobacterium tumefaciens complex TaxID=1183400 RepID=UPI0007619AD4|nr:hypothetical protein [Agrobacterium tumefaciens]AYM04332.1 hypothetical protein At1D1460_00890 [Agrobacterium tumefaciens]KWT88867.1 hypothetical protein ASB65_01725 [Agrobacterium tumefaciens str. B6]NSZ31191.1 hypothetical protein [Agrobacterium tumefaciens]NTA03678.1 hypothetical protein [Agrobacterium tumefaciens]NTA90270.1 hypothetical protein [Agrobacterium tumefaciens]
MVVTAQADITRPASIIDLMIETDITGITTAGTGDNTESGGIAGIGAVTIVTARAHRLTVNMV